MQCGEDGVGRRRVDRLRPERHPRVWHNGGLESDSVKGWGGVETATEGRRRFRAAWRKEKVDAARHRQEKGEATRDWESC